MSRTKDVDSGYQKYMQENAPDLGEIHRGPEARQKRREVIIHTEQTERKENAMRKADLQQRAVELIKQLSTEKLKGGIDYLTYLYDKEEREATHESGSDFEIVLDEIVRKYDRAWNTLAKS